MVMTFTPNATGTITLRVYSTTSAIAYIDGIQLELRQWNAAENALQRYLEIRQKELASTTSYTELDTQVYLMLARIADERNDAQAANNWINRIEPAQIRTNVQLQRIELMVQQQGKYDQALQMLQDVPANTPREKTTHALLTSLVYEKQERYADSVRVLSAAIEHDRNNPELLYIRGFAYSQLGQHAKREKDWRKVIQLQPQSAIAYNALGYGLADRNGMLDANMKLFLTVGFCGGFTTFSTFMNESLQLFRSDNILYGALYAGGSVFLGLVAVFMGLQIVKAI